MTTKVNLMALATALCAVLVAPVAFADSDADLIRQLEQRLLAAEDKLEASEATIDAQRSLLKSSGAAPGVSQGSGLDAFFSSLEVGGHVTGSYVYSFENPSQTTNGTGGAISSQPLNQFNTRHNTFELDAVKLELGKPTNGPGTAGFQIDLLLGNNSGILNTATNSAAGLTAGTGVGASDNGVHIQEAYVQYNYNGIDLSMGKFETLLGYEVLDSPYNANVSHGLLYTFAIPLFHTGVLASGEINESLGWAAGLTNGFNNQTDLNENKGALGQLRYSAGPISASLQGYYGADLPSVSAGGFAIGGAPNLASVEHGNKDDALILDFITTYKASDSLNFWINADWGEQENVLSTLVATPTPGSSAVNFVDAEWYGVSIGSEMQLNDKTSIALRGEWFKDEDGYRLAGVVTPPTGIPPTDVVAYGLTGTVGYALTSNLKARAELRYDRIDADLAIDQVIPSGTFATDFEEDGVTGYLEVSYSFD